ncbi:MAG: methyltransferase domain-containing protein [Myxococcota bacterium]
MGVSGRNAEVIARSLIRRWYTKIAVTDTGQPWRCMNYGYLGPLPLPLTLTADEEADRFALQLYAMVLGAEDLSGLDLLEVGCGRGGGSAFAARHRSPRSVVGLDLIPEAIALARQFHQGLENLRFAVGDAEQLPFEAQSFDRVFNVESSHGYPNVARFYAEVARVLRPNGRFLYADFCRPEFLPVTRGLLDAAGFSLENEVNLTPNVLWSLAATDSIRREAGARLPPDMQARYAEFAALEGSEAHRDFATGRMHYFGLELLLRK